PHRVLEGMLIAAHAIEADAAYIYLRDEYPLIRDVLLNEIPKVEAAGLGLPGGIHLRRGAGAYVCGEESAMLESIEGKRGYPRHRPPFPAEAGLFGHPTLVQNVETLYWFREILEKGADWYRTGGALRLFSVSGRVKEPGVKLVRAGITTRALIEKHCGGMVAGHRLKAFLPGGAAGGILPAGLADLPLDFDTLEEHGAALGSASVIVLSDQDDLRKIALNLMRFFEAESCGQCTPCRAGTEKAVKLLERPDLDRALLEELSRAMADASICGLGQTAPNPVMSLFRHFPDALSSGDA
ncbi:MAG: NADH-ubiquinone oxidoreductase-F iron-sulfur binding region domain-containing protein, partial [Alphaproteobacteria bacterium]